MEVTDAASPAEALAGLVEFGKFFAGVLFDTYGGVIVRSNELQPVGAPRLKRALKMSAPDVHFFSTSDGVELRLTRFNGGGKGPVLLSPGFGTSTLAYTIDTVDTNLPEALFASGYDVWLFDYRASPDLPSAHTQFTLDDSRHARLPGRRRHRPACLRQADRAGDGALRRLDDLPDVDALRTAGRAIGRLLGAVVLPRVADGEPDSRRARPRHRGGESGRPDADHRFRQPEIRGRADRRCAQDCFRPPSSARAPSAGASSASTARSTNTRS